MIDAIELARSRHKLHLWAYVIMPEHVHLVFWPTTPDYSVSSILTTLKQSAAKRALRYVKRQAPDFLALMEDRRVDGAIVHRFWQRGGGYDRNLIEPVTVLNQIDYLDRNPLRRGLCERMTDWLWSSAAEREHPGTGLLRLDRASVPSVTK
jgi:putative transposase